MLAQSRGGKSWPFAPIPQTQRLSRRSHGHLKEQRPLEEPLVRGGLYASQRSALVPGDGSCSLSMSDARIVVVDDESGLRSKQKTSSTVADL